MVRLALVAMLVACAAAQAAETRVLHDFAEPLRATLPEAEAQLALSRLFPTHLDSVERCRNTAKRQLVRGHMRKTVCSPGGDTKFPECEVEIDVPQPGIDRAEGNLVPAILAFARGSFTAPKADELALWVAPNYCSDPARSLPNRIMVLAGGKLVFDAEHAPRTISYASTIDFIGMAAKDIDDDGRHELLLEVQYYATMDITRSDAQLIRLRPKNRIEPIAELPQVFEYQCDLYYGDGRYKRAHIVRYERRPGAPRFLEPEYRDLDCDKGTPR